MHSRTKRIVCLSAFPIALLISAALWPLGSAAQDPTAQSEDSLLPRAGKAAQQFVERLGMVRYTEHLTQVKLQENGKVAYHQEGFYDSLTMVRKEAGRLSVDASAEQGLRSAGFEIRPLLVTTGFSTLALVLHPSYEGSFRFTRLEDEVIEGRSLSRLHFEYVEGADSPTALRLRGRTYPLALSGTIWLDPETASAVRVEATLAEPMEDVGLKELRCDVRYAPVVLPESSQAWWLPVSASVELQTPTQRWRNVHIFSKYRKYVVDILVTTGETP